MTERFLTTTLSARQHGVRGAVHIPANNRCIYRVQNDIYYSLYYQIKAASIDGAQSQWTLPRKLLMYREAVNLGTQTYSYMIINYQTSDSLQP